MNVEGVGSRVENMRRQCRASRIQKNHPVDNIIGQLDQGMTTRRKEPVDYRKMVGLIGESCFISKVDPKNVDVPLKDEYWISAMQEELVQFQRNDVWELVPRPKDHNVIGTKWIFEKKSDELELVTRNKARLVAQGYSEVEGVDFEETFATMVRLNVIRLLFSLVCLMKFKSFQVKQMKEIIFISQSKYAKSLVNKYGLENTKSKRTPTATHVKVGKDVDGTSVDISNYRSMIGSLFYLTASRPDIAYSVGVCARFQGDPKESHLNQVKRIIKYVNGTVEYGLLYTFYPNSTLVGFCDVDWVGNAEDRKSTSGGYFFVGNNLVSWFSKK
ncbi:hypothetical protein LIER_23420 [Lithospermum erythrorhizon]|uniref:Reverse transcriptase Ty1/copia-type domain-containing protein n=1 Tax=Lithospermum erythrorhizon TaxID=34254 RepID=A0AAV3R122_LITER